LAREVVAFKVAEGRKPSGDTRDFIWSTPDGLRRAAKTVMRFG